MVSGTKTVMTQSYQFWLKPSLAQLGWAGPAAVTSTFTEPLDTYCDMSHLLGRETWSGPDVPQSIAYFCGVFPDVAGEDQADATERACRTGRAFLGTQSPMLWPNTATAAGGFDFDLLVDPAGSVGEARFNAQYWRANFAPSERYSQAVPGTIGLRLGAGDSGYGNLILTGDWVRNGLNAGCVEAAVISGMQAAREVIGGTRAVPGENHRWLTGSG